MGIPNYKRLLSHNQTKSSLYVLAPAGSSFDEPAPAKKWDKL